MNKKPFLLLIAAMLGSSSAIYAADLQAEASEIARDATDIARDTADIHVDREQLMQELASVSAQRVERHADELALANAVASGDLATAQLELGKIQALSNTIHAQEASVAQLHHEISADRLERFLDRAELMKEVRELTGNTSIQGTVSTAIAEDRANLEAAISALQASIQARRQALTNMSSAVQAGDLAGAQVALAQAESLKATIKQQAKAVEAAHKALAKDRAAAKEKASEHSSKGGKGKK